VVILLAVIRRMNKEQLIIKIRKAFKDVNLEEGIGLWEGQGHDDRLTIEECRKLRMKDEKEDWSKIPIIDLYKCSSSLSFFDAKGMRFHIPIFLLFALDVFEKEKDKLLEQEFTEYYFAPDIDFHLLAGLRYLNDKSDMGKSMWEYDRERFSLITTEQTKCIIGFLKYRMREMEEYYERTYAKELGTSPSAVNYNKDYIQLQKGIEYWENKVATANTVHKK